MLDSNDPYAVTLGVRFTAQSAGTITGIKFYKGPNNTGTHIGSLWSASGTLLASATFTGESTSGWQTVTFATPVTVSAGTEYTAAYRTTVGHYSVTLGTFSGAYTHGALSVPANGGSFSYADGFPGSQISTNYLVDVLFTPTVTPISVVSVSPANGATGVDPGTAVRVTLSTPIADGYQLSASTGGAGVAARRPCPPTAPSSPSSPPSRFRPARRSPCPSPAWSPPPVRHCPRSRGPSRPRRQRRRLRSTA